jgi:hypothetical protein
MSIRSEEWNPIIDDILAAIATTPKSLNSICAENDRFPTAKTFYQWMECDDALSERYARAKKAQLQVLADQIVDLSDNDRICEKITIKADGTREVVIIDQVERTKLQIDSRKWLLAKLNPKKYGDRLEVQQTGDPLGDLISEFRREYEAIAKPDISNATT